MGYYEPGAYPLLANYQTGMGPVFRPNTWKWSCAGWIPLLGREVEVPVGLLAYEPHLRMVVGFYKATLKGWDGKTWVDVSEGPSDMSGTFYLAFDEARDQLVVLAVRSDVAYTYTYQKGKWAKVATIGPRGHFGSALAYDPRTKTTILFGSNCFDDGLCTDGRDTWAWDGKSWKQLHPASSPPKGHGDMAFNAATNEMILLASDHSMWTWDGTNWKDMHTSGPSLGRYWSVVYDKAGRQLLLWAASETWVYKGGGWSRAAAPAPRPVLPPASTARTNPPPINQTPVVSGARVQSPWTGAPCRIPYADITEATGGFVSLPDGQRYADPAATVALPGQIPGRFGQNPGLTYLADIGKWVPVPLRWVSPDHSLFVYQSGEQIRGVKIADNASFDVTSGAGWMLIGPGEGGVYIGKPGIQGAWFVPYGSTPRQVADHGRWDVYSSGALWGWDASNNLLRLATAVGFESRWGAKQYSWVAGFDRSGQPFVVAMGSMWLAHSDGSFTLIWNGNNDASPGAPVITIAAGSWFAVGGGRVGTPGHGFYLYVPGGGVKYLVGLDAILAGPCS